MNPVLARETKERFRGRRTMPWLLIVWILAIGLIAYLLFIIAREIAQSQFGLGQALASGFMGRFLFESMTLLVVTAVVMVVPGLTALSIIGERERQTFHLLQVTQMSPYQLVLGKLGSSIAYFGVLIVAVLPIVALPMIFGGTTFSDTVVALGFVALLTVMLGSVSMWMSARAKSSRSAVAMSYAIAFLISFLSFAGLGAEYFALDDQGNLPTEGVESVSALVNPYFGLASAVQAPLEVGQDRFFASPYTPFELHLFARQGAGGAVDLGIGQLEPGTIRIEGGRQFVNYSRPPLWVYTVVIYLVLTGIGLWRAATIVAAPTTRIRARNGQKRAEPTPPSEVGVDATS